MIKYSLACRAPNCGHTFDSWFGSSADFDRLAAAGHLACPACGGDVGKAIMAPAVSKSGHGQSRPIDHREALRALRRKIEAAAEHVGDRFADEALRMHAGDIPERMIYGDATPDQVEHLRAEGVPVAQIPWVPLEDA